jgi:hypothetical protein
MNSVIVGIYFLICSFSNIVEQNNASIRYESLNMILPVDQIAAKKETETFFKKKQFTF